MFVVSATAIFLQYFTLTNKDYNLISMALRNISSTSREMSSAPSALSADDMPSSEPTPWMGETLLVTSLPTTLGAAASGMLLTSASATWTASRPLFPAWARTVSLSSIWLPGNKKKIFKSFYITSKNFMGRVAVNVRIYMKMCNIFSIFSGVINLWLWRLFTDFIHLCKKNNLFSNCLITT